MDLASTRPITLRLNEIKAERQAQTNKRIRSCTHRLAQRQKGVIQLSECAEQQPTTQAKRTQ